MNFYSKCWTGVAILTAIACGAVTSFGWAASGTITASKSPAQITNASVDQPELVLQYAGADWMFGDVEFAEAHLADI